MNLIHKDGFIYNNTHWLLRFVLAATFILHGYPKLGYNMNLGFPGFTDYAGYLVGPFELFGGLFLLIGGLGKEYFTRIGGILISIIMVGAIYKFHFHQGYKMHSVVEAVPYTLGYEWQAILLVTALLFAIKGNDV